MNTDYIAVSDLVDAAWKAYILLQRFPVALRLKYQSELCALRDSIAAVMDTSIEDVQSKSAEQVVNLGGII